MNRKTLIKRTLIRRTVTAFLLAALPFTATAVVQNPAPSTNPAQAQRLTNLKAKGTAEIDRRLSNLTAALEKLQASTQLAVASKSALEKQLQDQMASLTTLKANLTADTELTSARTHVASITTGYRVYALTLPKVRLVTTADRLTVATDKLQALQAKLKTEADAQNSSPASGISTSQQQVIDMATKLAATEAKIAEVTAQLLALQPSDYNADHKLLGTYRDTLRSAQAELKAIRDEAKTLIDILGSTVKASK